MQTPETPQAVEAAAARFREDYERLRTEIGRVLVGQADVVEGVLTSLFAGGHVLLEGVPGIGKTLLVRTLASALNLEFSRLQFTPDLMPADITGTTIVTESPGADGRLERQFTFRRGPIFAQIVLADEINRATPKTQSALLEAMAERSVTVAGTTHPLPAPFLVLATQNPIEQEGTYPLPEAQLDRFFFKLLVGSASRADLTEILARTTGGVHTRAAPVLDSDTIIEHQSLVRRVASADRVTDYAVRLVLATHPAGSTASRSAYTSPMVSQFVRFGASPRAAQAMMLGAKCRALLDGRAAVSIDDLQSVALPALRHRVMLNFEGSAEGMTTDVIIANLIETLPHDAER
jgi:MoxR-like ATPase